jgi:diguanylate cyclase (GGDEF)-like protein
MKTVSAKTFTAYYVAALSIIAGLSIICHFILAGEVRISKSSAALINVSGRQRMLSQRIAGMAAQYRLGVPGSREDLVAATDAFADGHRRLMSANSVGAADTESQSLRAIYSGGADSLDAEALRYIATARQIAGLPANDPAQLPLLTGLLAQARAPLLRDLDQVVAVRQRAAEDRMQKLQRLQWAILVVVLATLVVEAFTIFKPLVHRIAQYTSELLHLATTDALTGLANRRSFMERAALDLENAARHQRPLSLLALDIDHFKRINDTYGHAAGDQVLAALAHSLTEQLRGIDAIGRLGGEEFAVLLPETSVEGATQIAERLRKAIGRLRIRSGDTVIAITASLGVAVAPEGATTMAETLAAADAALYRAKATGRNRVIVGDVLVPESAALADTMPFQAAISTSQS